VIFARNYENIFKFVKVTHRNILFFSGHGVDRVTVFGFMCLVFIGC